MYYHIILTERCNLRCTYCYGKSMNEFDNGLGDKWDYDMKAPFDSEVRVERLKRFIKPEDTLIFYGGEPLVMMPRMMEIMDQVDCKFQIQSNGILLNQLPTKYLLKLSKMLISIDGDSDRTDTNRGKMKYKIITKNLEDARLRGFTGEIVALMAMITIVKILQNLYENIIVILINYLTGGFLKLKKAAYLCYILLLEFSIVLWGGTKKLDCPAVLAMLIIQLILKVIYPLVLS